MLKNRSRARTWALRIARVALVIGVVAWLASVTELSALADAVRSIPAWVFAGMLVFGALNTLIAGVRWRVVMRSFGAAPLPNLGALVRAYLVGFFYNTFVPGSVGGDVVRGVVSRGCFENPATGLFVVATERLLGLSALGVIFLVGVAVGPALVSRETAMWAGAVLLALGLVVLIAAKVSGLMTRLWASFPRVERTPDLFVAFGLSLIGHLVSFAIHWILAIGLALPVTVSDLLLVVPLSLVAGVLPVAVAGVGPREAAMVGMLAVLGVARERAMVFSLGFWSVVLGMALAGGVLQLLGKGLAVTEAAPEPPKA